jgi:hypothetical protein
MSRKRIHSGHVQPVCQGKYRDMGGVEKMDCRTNGEFA